MFLTRRLFCLSLPCAAALSPPCQADGASRSSCNLSFDALESSVDKSTISPLDAAKYDFENGLIIILADLRSYLGTNFDLFLYEDDVNYPNAAFTSDLTYRPTGVNNKGSDGVVLIGTNLIAESREYFGSLSAPLTALCAHEAGHSLQAKYSRDDWHLYERYPEDEFHPDRYELCADFVCGYYGAHRQLIDPSYNAATQAVMQFNKGDPRPIGHATHKQRGDAVEAGYRLGRTGLNDSKLALEAGLQYVLGVDFAKN